MAFWALALGLGLLEGKMTIRNHVKVVNGHDSPDFRLQRLGPETLNPKALNPKL